MSREGRWRGGWRRAIVGALAGVAVCALAPALAVADEGPAAAAANLSNQAFAILNSLNAAGAAGTSSPLLGPVASFAGDAQSLSQALSKSDDAGAGRAMAALKSDDAALDAAIKEHPGSIKAADWKSLQDQLAALEKRVPSAPASAAAAPPSSSAPPPATAESGPGSGASTTPPEVGEAGGAGMAAGSGSERGADERPRIKITSRSVENGVSHIKGFFEGTYLKSAGIYEGGRRVKPIKIDRILGRQKVDFDLALNGADIATNLRVYDHAGRRAVASVYGGNATALAGSSEEGGVEVDRGSGSSSGGNTAEIPSHTGESLGGGGLAPLGNVQINITSINAIDPLNHVYQVSGQIDGRGVRHAGIYVDGRLVKQLPVSSGAGVSSFNTSFMMNGASATIRAFGAGNRYVESSIQVPSTGMPPMIASPYGASPYGMSPYGSYGSSPSFNINIGPGAVSPYGMTPYGMNPYGGAYGSPYGMNPYANPYGMSPYGSYAAPPAAHPWGNAPAPPGAAGR